MAPSTDYSVYVIELAPAACRKTDCPATRSGKPHVYVGETGKTPEERFQDHKTEDHRASVKVVRDHGVRLRPRLSHGFGPYPTRDRARVGEAELAERLRKRNYHVFGGH
jgi:hypothetical protein